MFTCVFDQHYLIIFLAFNQNIESSVYCFNPYFRLELQWQFSFQA